MCLKKMFRPLLALLLALVFATASAQPAIAESYHYWNNGGDETSLSDGDNWDGGLPPVNGQSLVFENSFISGDTTITNDLAGLTLDQLVFTGNTTNSYFLSGNAINLTSGVRDDQPGGTLSVIDNAIAAKGTLRMEAAGGSVLGFGGTINIGGYNMALRNYEEGLIIMAGAVTGKGTIYIYGTGQGVYLVDGASMYRPVSVRDGGFFFGDGRAGSLTIVSTGFYMAENCMTVNNLTIDGYIYARLGGATNCSGRRNNRVNAKGKVDVSGGTLSTRYSLEPGYVPKKGEQYILISNDGSDKVVGTFKDKPQGRRFKIGTYTFSISYRGGSGNDVVLTRM